MFVVVVVVIVVVVVALGVVVVVAGLGLGLRVGGIGRVAGGSLRVHWLELVQDQTERPCAPSRHVQTHSFGVPNFDEWFKHMLAACVGGCPDNQSGSILTKSRSNNSARPSIPHTHTALTRKAIKNM